MDKSWRRKALESLKPGMRLLDLGCGTGDLSLAAVSKLNHSGEVVGLDFSENMLKIAQARYEKGGHLMNGRFKLVQKSAEELPLEAAPFDLVVSGFVLRNIYQNIDAILQGVYSSLRPGGEISFLDFTEPPGLVRKTLWKIYMNTVVSFYGLVLFGKKFPLFYMTDSAARFLKAPEFIEKLKQAGFVSVRAERSLMGIIVLYRGSKP